MPKDIFQKQCSDNFILGDIRIYSTTRMKNSYALCQGLLLWVSGTKYVGKRYLCVSTVGGRGRESGCWCWPAWEHCLRCCCSRERVPTFSCYWVKRRTTLNHFKVVGSLGDQTAREPTEGITDNWYCGSFTNPCISSAVEWHSKTKLQKRTRLRIPLMTMSLGSVFERFS